MAFRFDDEANRPSYEQELERKKEKYEINSAKEGHHVDHSGHFYVPDGHGGTFSSHLVYHGGISQCLPADRPDGNHIFESGTGYCSTLFRADIKGNRKKNDVYHRP